MKYLVYPEPKRYTLPILSMERRSQHSLSIYLNTLNTFQWSGDTFNHNYGNYYTLLIEFIL